MPEKIGIGKNVFVAAMDRIGYVFDNFPRIYVSFSGGKDSTVMLHMVAEMVRTRKRKIGLLFIDWEAQYQLTIEHVQKCFDDYADVIDPYWVALPFLTTNACSQFEPEWICWQPDKRNLWVRDIPDGAISDQGTLPFYYYPMTFEEFVPAFGKWFAQGKPCACFVGIRADESLNRWRTIATSRKQTIDGHKWTTWIGDGVFNAYPIYDWKTQDIWVFHGKTGLPHNKLYDRMHQAGLTIHQMRICEPYGDEQRKGLHLFSVIEPDTWGRVVARVSGANTGQLYANERGNVMGNGKVFKPDGRTWEEFAKMLLSSMPEKTADHYKDKIAVWMRWWQVKGETIKDELPGDTGTDMFTWRRVCKVLLKNDYWCKGLCFSPTKSEAYERYKKVMKKRRTSWGIF